MEPIATINVQLISNSANQIIIRDPIRISISRLCSVNGKEKVRRFKNGNTRDLCCVSGSFKSFLVSPVSCKSSSEPPGPVGCRGFNSSVEAVKLVTHQCICVVRRSENFHHQSRDSSSNVLVVGCLEIYDFLQNAPCVLRHP